MASTGSELVRKALATYRARRRELATLSFVAVMVTVCVALGLHQRGIAATRTELVLDCHYAGSGAHAHDSSCYDAAGNLVCPLKEREYHVHDDSCYTEARELACGQVEHQHSEACYDEEGNLACGLAEHAHTDACYQVTRELTCGKEETAETHTHGPGCFREVTVDDGETELEPQGAGEDPAADPGAGEPADPAVGAEPAAMPEQAFAHEFKDQDGKLVLRVDVKAPEGTLPEGTTMRAEWVDPSTLSKKQRKAVDRALAEKTDGKVLEQQAVDITFLDERGQKVEPAKKVTVTFTSDLVDTKDHALVVHIDDLTEKQLAEMRKAINGGKAAEEAEPKRKAEAIDSLTDEELRRRDASVSGDQLAFDADQFSTYVLSVTSLHRELRCVGDDVTINVDASAGAGVPAGATLQVTEISAGTVEHEAYQEAAVKSVGVDDERDVALARFFDIKIVDASGQEIQPAEAVQVSIELADAPRDAEGADVVHFDSATGDPEVVKATEDAGTSTFEAERFSVYGVVYTVDFHWDIDGKTYEFSLPGGGFVSLDSLVEALGIAGEASGKENADAVGMADDNMEHLCLSGVALSDLTKKFVADVDSVTFSNPNLVWTGAVGEDITVGELKTAYGLDCEYSAELTENQIREINAQIARAGDWALISLRPFQSEESLTITMKDGDQFAIKVTDYQLSTNVLAADGNTYTIKVTYDDGAEIPDGSYLEAEEILSDDERYEGLFSDSAAALGKQKEEIEQIRFFNITIRYDEEIIEPKKAVTVEIHYEDPVSCDGSQDFDVIHFGSEGTEVFTPEVRANEEDQTTQDFIFQTESFSTFAITTTATGNAQDLVDNEYVLFLSSANVMLSPEGQYNNSRLKAISANSNGTSISADVDELPVWKIESGSATNTYRLSTTYNNQKVYLHLENSNSGRAWVDTAPQDLRIMIREEAGGTKKYRFAYNTNGNTPPSLDLSAGQPAQGFQAYGGQSGNQNELFTLYQIGEQIQRKVTVHFVDREGTPLTAVAYTGNNNSYVNKNTDGTFTIFNDWHGATGNVSLKNDFGLTRYTYASTHLAKNTNTEWPEAEYNYTLDGIVIDHTINSTGHALQFTTSTGGDGTRTDNSGYGQHDFADVFRAHIPPERVALSEYTKAGDQDVYVIMDPYPAASSTGGTGGTGSSGGSGGSGSSEFAGMDPIFHKDLVNNHDGTYELSLSVVGKGLNESETPKANVLLVVDTSSSMVSNTGIQYEDEEGVRRNGNRMDATKAQLKKLGRKLLGRNNLGNTDTEDDDIVEVAMVAFDGEAYYPLNWTNQYNTYKDIVDNHLDTHRGTNWEDALREALNRAQKMREDQPSEPVYVIFFTDGEPSQYSNFNGTTGLENGIETNNSRYGYRYFFAMYGKETSKDEARAIVRTPGVQLYTMFAFGPTDDNQPTYDGVTQFGLLHDLAKYAYNKSESLENKYCFNATNVGLLEQSFNEILRQINSSLGISDVVMNDSFTSLTVAGVNTPSNGSTGGFRYWKIPAGGTWEDKEAWAEAPAATIDQSGSVKWDLSGRTLENDVTYAVTFTVWPSQEAYDWVADLKNGVRTWQQAIDADLAENVLFRVDDGNGGYTYEVATNPQSTVPNDGTVGTNGTTYTKTTEEIVSTQGHDAGTTTHTTENPNTYVKETITYTQNDDGTWTKKVVSEVVSAFNMPEQRMTLTDTAFKVDKFWDMNGKLTELHNFLYHKLDGSNEWASSEKKIIFKISKGYNDSGDPNPYGNFGTNGLPLGWQDEEREYDWVGQTTTIEGHKIGTRWQEDLDISFGLMLTKAQAEARGLDLTNTEYLHTVYDGVDYYLLKGDRGWDYAIDEVNGLNYQFDFRTSVYHPMLIDGKPAHVKFTVEGNTWTITEMKKDLTALTGENILRGGLRVQKELLDVNGERIKDDETTTFEFTINLVNEDPVFIPDEGVETVPWYGVTKTTEVDGHTVTQDYFYQYAPDGVFDHYATEAEATVTLQGGILELKPGYQGNIMEHGGSSATVTYDGREYTGYTQAYATIHVKAEEDWRIANIPLGTTVTVSEPDKPGYEFVNAKLDGNIIGTTTTDDMHTTTATTVKPGDEITIKITNKEKAIDLVLYKAALVDGKDKLLPGAKFSLQKWNDTDETWEYVAGVNNPFDVVQNTGYTIQNIKPGLYKLHEVKSPDGYIITEDTYFKVVDRQILLCDENGNTMIGSGDDAVPYENEMAKIETTEDVTKIKLTVYNTPGTPLPNAGGFGTEFITLLGSTLILGAGVLLYKRWMGIRES